MTYSREDVERSYHQGHKGQPMVNVKVYGGPESGWRGFRRDQPDADERFTEEWVRENVSEDSMGSLFWLMCETRWEDLQMEAEETFGSGVKVWSAGRSGGWAAVEGLDDVDDWDAVMLAKWRHFERVARATADYIPTDMISSLYINEWECAESERIEDAGLNRDPIPA